jgi:ankyrin repeat protein
LGVEGRKVQVGTKGLLCGLLAFTLLAGGCRGRVHSRPDALLDAAAGGDAEQVRALLREDADVNARDYRDRTPLYRAAEGGYADVARLLIDGGARVNEWGGGIGRSWDSFL